MLLPELQNYDKNHFSLCFTYNTTIVNKTKISWLKRNKSGKYNLSEFN